MVLARVVVEVLVAVAEVEAQHVAVGAGAQEAGVQVDPGHRRAQAHVQGIQGRVPVGEGALDGLVEGPPAHPLDRHVLDLGALPGDHLHRRARQGLALQVGGEDLVHVGDLAAGLGDDEHPGEGRHPGPTEPPGHPHRQLQTDTPGHVEEDPVGPERGVQRRELPLGCGDRLGGEVLPEEVRVLVDGVPERGEDDPLLRELVHQVRVADAPVELDEVAGGVPVLFHGLVHGIGEVGPLHGPDLARHGHEGVQLQLPGEIGVAPLLELRGGHGGPLVDLPRLQPARPEPLGLPLGPCRDGGAVEVVRDPLHEADPALLGDRGLGHLSGFRFSNSVQVVVCRVLRSAFPPGLRAFKSDAGGRARRGSEAYS